MAEIAEKESKSVTRRHFLLNMLFAVLLIAALAAVVITIHQKAKLQKQMEALTEQVQQVQELQEQQEAAAKQNEELASQIEELQKQNEALAAQVKEQQEQLESAAAAIAEAEKTACQKLYPDFYAPQPYDATEVTAQAAYLTFDDGPSENTDIILDTLAERGVKATFFVTGKTDAANLNRMRRMVAEGHTIGMHTYTHDYESIYASVKDYLADMYQIFTLIQETTGVTPTCFRFPGGSINDFNQAIYQTAIDEMIRRGFVPYDWNVSSEDATGVAYTASELTSHVLRGARGKTRAIVLMHDSAAKTTTAAAVGDMITGLQEMGFTLQPLTSATKPILF